MNPICTSSNSGSNVAAPPRDPVPYYQSAQSIKQPRAPPARTLCVCVCGHTAMPRHHRHSRSRLSSRVIESIPVLRALPRLPIHTRLIWVSLSVCDGPWRTVKTGAPVMRDPHAQGRGRDIGRGRRRFGHIVIVLCVTQWI